jgi:hypothetical protein
MSWFKPSVPKHPVEQDGPPEQILKDRLREFFQCDGSVQRAYLARVSVGHQAGVALCLKSQLAPDRGLVEKIGGVFKGVFNAHEHLDILFLNSQQEAELTRVCKHFFSDHSDS